MNIFSGIGRLTADPRNVSGVVHYTIAIDRIAKQGEEAKADFIPVTAFGKSAEFAEKHFKKGMRVGVTGSVRTGSYTDKEGKKVYVTEIYADRQEFADGAKGGEK